MHNCPICRENCNCPKEEFNSLPFSVCNHCDLFGDDPFEETPTRKPFVDRIPKWLKLIDACLTLLIALFCYVIGFKLVIAGDLFSGAVVLALGCIMGLLMNIISRI